MLPLALVRCEVCRWVEIRALYRCRLASLSEFLLGFFPYKSVLGRI